MNDARATIKKEKVREKDREKQQKEKANTKADTHRNTQILYHHLDRFRKCGEDSFQRQDVSWK